MRERTLWIVAYALDYSNNMLLLTSADLLPPCEKALLLLLLYVGITNTFGTTRLGLGSIPNSL